jgi:hypothetical protein
MLFEVEVYKLVQHKESDIGTIDHVENENWFEA